MVMRDFSMSMFLKIKIPDLLKKDNLCVFKPQFSVCKNMPVDAGFSCPILQSSFRKMRRDWREFSTPQEGAVATASKHVPHLQAPGGLLAPLPPDLIYIWTVPRVLLAHPPSLCPKPIVFSPGSQPCHPLSFPNPLPCLHKAKFCSSHPY